jgi:hypothetical protein
VAVTLEELEIKFKAGFGGLQAQLNTLKTNLDGVDKTAKKTQNAFASMGKIVNTFLSVYAVRALINVGKESLKMANDAVESENLFKESMKGMSGAARDWSDDLSDSLGLNAYAVRKNVGTLNVMFNSMGMGTKKSYEMSTALTELAEDMASFYNLSSADAFTKLSAGMTGETEPLKRLGILVDENTIKQYALANGISSNTKTLTQQEKVLARYGAIMQQTATAQGDMARTIDSPANQLRVLSNTMDQASIAFGRGMQTIQAVAMPTLNALSKAALTAAQAIAYLMGGIGGVSKTNVAAILTTKRGAVATGKLADKLTDTSNAYKKAGGAAKKAAKDANVGLKAFDEINKITEKEASGGGGGGGKIEVPDTGELTDFQETIETVSAKVRELAEKFKQAENIIVPALAGISAGFIAFKLTGNPAIGLVVGGITAGITALIREAERIKAARLAEAFGDVSISLDEASIIVSRNLSTSSTRAIDAIDTLKEDLNRALQRYTVPVAYSKKVMMILNLMTMTTGYDQFQERLTELKLAMQAAGGVVRTSVIAYLDALLEGGKIDKAEYQKRRDELENRISKLDSLADQIIANVTAQIDAALEDGKVDPDNELPGIKETLSKGVDTLLAGYADLKKQLYAEVDADLKAGKITKDGAAAKKADIDEMISAKLAELGTLEAKANAELGITKWTTKTLTEDQLVELENALNAEIAAARDLVLTAEVQVTASASALLGENYEGSATQAALHGLFGDVQETINTEAAKLKTLFAKAHEFCMTPELMASIQTSIETSRQAAEMIANNGLSSEGAWLKAKQKGQQLSAESVDNLLTSYQTYTATKQTQFNASAESVINGIYSAMANGSVTNAEGMASIKEIENGLAGQLTEMQSGAVIDVAKTLLPSISAAISSGELNVTDIQAYRDSVLKIFEGVDYSSLSTEAQTAMLNIVSIFQGAVGPNGQTQQILQDGGYELLNISQRMMWAIQDDMRAGRLTPEEAQMIFVNPSKDALEDLKEKMGGMTNSAIWEYLDAWIKAAPEASNEAKKLAEAAKSGVDGVELASVGNNAADGYTNALGSDSNINKAKAAGKKLANAARSAMTTTLDINSPSKVFGWIADMSSAGFVNHLLASIPAAEDAAKKLSGAAIGGMAIDTSPLDASPLSITSNGSVSLETDNSISGAIESGIERGVRRVMDSLNIVLKVDANELGRAAARGINNVTRATGRTVLEF